MMNCLAMISLVGGTLQFESFKTTLVPLAMETLVGGTLQFESFKT